MLLVVALIGVLVAVPVAINVLAVGQAPTSEEAALVVQARQAANAGISDYINRVQSTPGGYVQYCSTGIAKWTCPSGSSAPASNPAFVNAPTLVGQWYTDGLTMRGVANGSPSYRYVVNSPNTANPALVTIYSIGQAGTQAGLHVSSTDEAALTICGAGCLTPVTASSCIKVPTGAVSAKIIAYGAQGGGGGSDAAGGVGALVTATVPVTATHILDVIPGQPGIPGNPTLVSALGIINIFAGAGGAGGSTALGTCSLSPPVAPPDLSGGNGALPGGLVDALTGGGGGGGGASMVFDTASVGGGMVATAGGGGGGGAGYLLAGLVSGPAGAGGGAGSTPPGSGVTAAGGLLGLLPSAPGGAGGVWNAPAGAGLCAATSVGGAKTAAGNGCGQDGYLPNSLLGLLTGGGGGGGGGYSAASLGGGGGGTTGGLLGLAAGAGGGGGAGYSYANNGTCPAPSVVPATPYPTGDTNGSGQISIGFYSGPCGTNGLTTVTGTIRPAAPPS